MSAAWAAFAASAAGYNGGGGVQRWAAGDGGGASDIRTSPTDLNTRLLVAGGGGGGGDTGSSFSFSATGGNGNYPSGDDGSDINPGPNPSGTPGDGGTPYAGGAIGTSSSAQSGCRIGPLSAFGAGGTGQQCNDFSNVDAINGAGGGGGGYYGGGAGGAGEPAGGGSSYVVPGALNSSFSTGFSSQVTLTPEGAPPTVAPASLSYSATLTQSTSAPQTVTITSNDLGPLHVVGETFDYSNGANGDDYFVGSGTCGDSVAAGNSCQLHVRFSPQGTGPSASTMTVQLRNAAGAPVTDDVALSGTGAAGSSGTNGTNGTNGATGSNGSTGATGTQGPKGSTGARGKTGARGPSARYTQGQVFSCHRQPGDRRVRCSFIDSAAAGQKLKVRMVSLHSNQDDDYNEFAVGKVTGVKGSERVMLSAPARLRAGVYLISLTYSRGRDSYTMRQTVYVS